MPSRTRVQRAALTALAITVVLALAKFVAWTTTGSLAVLSQALDSFVDIVALALVVVSVRVAARPADATHHYGHAKAENLLAFGQTVVLSAVVVGVVYQAIVRLAGRPADVAAPWYAVALLITSIIVDAARVSVLLRTARAERSEALRAGALNIAADIGTASVALLSLIAVRTGFESADAIGALIVAVPVSIAAVRLGTRSANVLMDRAPDAPAAAIEAAAARVPGVEETRRVRVRGDGKQLFADVTVAAGRTVSLERAHDIAERVEAEIGTVAPGADVVVHVEPIAETSGLVERVHAAASRVDGVHEVHNVSVHAFAESGETKLHVTLHAKVPPETSLENAHRLSDVVEAAVAEELGSNARVDTHIEPMTVTVLGRDVTAAREDIVDSIRRLALEEPDVIDCHEVIVTSIGDEVSVVAHVRGRGSLALDRIHMASERIEKTIRTKHAEIGPILIHFEPG